MSIQVGYMVDRYDLWVQVQEFQLFFYVSNKLTDTAVFQLPSNSIIQPFLMWSLRNDYLSTAYCHRLSGAVGKQQVFTLLHFLSPFLYSQYRFNIEAKGTWSEVEEVLKLEITRK